MSVRRLVVLGTSSQVPTRSRNHNGYFLEWDGKGILFDPGEGSQRQLLLAGVPASRIHHICITHFHGDHCLGLAGIIQRLSLDKVTRPTYVYYPASGQVFLDRLRHASLFVDVTNLVLVPIHSPGVIYSDAQFSLITHPLEHSVESWGYRLEEAERWKIKKERLEAQGVVGPAVGQLQRQGFLDRPEGRLELSQVSAHQPGQVFSFIMDTRVCEGASLLARDADLVVCESTYLDSETREAHEYGHLTAKQAAHIAAEGCAGLLVLTHFSQRYDTIEPFVSEAEQVHKRVLAVKDGDVVPFPERGIFRAISEA